MQLKNIITEKQHKLDSHLLIYQTFVDEFNVSEDTSDTYRQAIINHIENLDIMLYNSYKTMLELKASKDFGLSPDMMINQRPDIPIRSRRIVAEQS